MAQGESHGLGFGNGSIIDLGAGLIEYRQTGSGFVWDAREWFGFRTSERSESLGQSCWVC
jgi:hypothetical protein